MMSPISPDAARSFSVEIVRTLRNAGFQALWAGGCVRDQLLGLTPKDYDVATNAVPEQIRQLFGHKRTLPIGAAFGVISVLGSREAGQVEVATFRRDGVYQDGRHPDSVAFSTPEHDAQRRDFTINGLFFDPLTETVYDYVGGEADLKRRIIRAIRNPQERFHEDKLRMLRAVRFAATFDFAIEAITLAAIRELANEIVIVSAERIAAEMRRMLVHPRRSLAVRLLRESELLTAILPEARAFDASDPNQDTSAANLRWTTTLALLDALKQSDFPTALAALLRALCHLPSESESYAQLLKSMHLTANASPTEFAGAICRRWKLSNEEIEIVQWLLKNETTIRAAEQIPWPKLQRILIAPNICQLLQFSRSVEEVVDGDSRGATYCENKLQLPIEQLNPIPFVTGDDLARLGFRPGPMFKEILLKVRDAQLEQQIRDASEAFELAHTLHREWMNK
jgi:poly(A) polymerase